MEGYIHTDTHFELGITTESISKGAHGHHTVVSSGAYNTSLLHLSFNEPYGQPRSGQYSVRLSNILTR